MAYIIKSLLPDAEASFYKNFKDDNIIQLTAKNISFCNTSGSAALVYLSFYNPNQGETFESGAILFGVSIDANEYLNLQLERDIYTDDEIFAYSGTSDVISMSIDIENDNGRYYYTPSV
jgi:hypothetical protein